MTDQTIAGVAGLLLISLLFSYVPRLKDWYAALAGEQKSLVMLGSLVAACGVLFAASCLGYAQEPACTYAGAKTLVPLFISALIANQGTYLVTRKLK